MAKAKSSKNFLDSTELWNRWLFEYLRDRELYFWDKPKVAKTFIWLRYARILFCGCFATLSMTKKARIRTSCGLFYFLDCFGVCNTSQ